MAKEVTYFNLVALIKFKTHIIEMWMLKVIKKCAEEKKDLIIGLTAEDQEIIYIHLNTRYSCLALMFKIKNKEISYSVHLYIIIKLIDIVCIYKRSFNSINIIILIIYFG